MSYKWPLMESNITREDLSDLIRFLETTPRLTQSGQVKAFEEEWSRWLGVKYSVFVNSGSSANLLSLAYLKQVKEAGEVIVPTLTWVSDIASVIQNGFDPVFVDINPKTLCMDDEQVIGHLNSRTRAVFLTHVQGFNGLSDRLLKALGGWGIPLIEDVCESHGATFRGRKLGTFGMISNFSFYFAHHMSTIEGGMVCTDDPAIYQAMRMLRSHGMVREATDDELIDRYVKGHPDLSPDFIFAFPAYNVRNTEIGAVLGRSQLKKLDENNRARQSNFLRFLNGLDADKYVTDFEIEGSCNYAFNLIIRHADDDFRDQVEKTLNENGVEFRRGSSGGGNQLRQPYLRSLMPAVDYADYPRVDHVHFYGYYIGNYPTLDSGKIDWLCDLLNEVPK